MTITLTPEVGDAPARLIPGRRTNRDGFSQFCADNPDVAAELLPDGTRQALVYRAGTSEPETINGFGAALSADGGMPGFSLDLTLLR